MNASATLSTGIEQGISNNEVSQKEVYWINNNDDSSNHGIAS